MERTKVIKALELHSQKAKPCLQDCPYGGLHYCGSEMAKEALSLIKELTEENDKLVEAGFDTVDCAIDKIRALEKEIELMRANHTEYFNRAQVNAIRLFAEKLKQAICDHTYPDFDKAGKPVNVWKATTGYDVIDELETELIKEILE